MSEKNAVTVQRNGIGGGTALFLIFLTLKLIDKIDWSWWWVFSPLWIPFALLLSFLVVFMMVAIPMALVSSWKDRRDPGRVVKRRKKEQLRSTLSRFM